MSRVTVAQFALLSSQHTLIQASIEEAHIVSPEPKEEPTPGHYCRSAWRDSQACGWAYIAVLSQSDTDAEKKIVVLNQPDSEYCVEVDSVSNIQDLIKLITEIPHAFRSRRYRLLVFDLRECWTAH